MANLTQNVSATVAIFGPAPSDLWGTLQWGGKWGEGTTKMVTKSISVSTASTAIPTDGYTVNASPKLGMGTFTVSGIGTDEEIMDAAGFHTVFPYPSSNHENIYIPTYTSQAVATVTYTSGAAAGGTWT